MVKIRGEKRGKLCNGIKKGKKRKGKKEKKDKKRCEE